MKRTNILLVFLLMITVSCSETDIWHDTIDRSCERIETEKPPIEEGVIGGLVFVWSISQKSTGDCVNIEVSTYFFESITDRYVRKIYLHKEMSGEISNSSADISKEDWDRIENLVQGIFTTHPDDIHCDCCDETLSYCETLYYIRGIHECIIESKRIEGCTDEDIELVRELFKELKESYFPGENMY